MNTRWLGIRSTRQGTSARMRDHSAALETVVMAMAFMQMSNWSARISRDGVSTWPGPGDGA